MSVFECVRSWGRPVGFHSRARKKNAGEVEHLKRCHKLLRSQKADILHSTPEANNTSHVLANLSCHLSTFVSTPNMTTIKEVWTPRRHNQSITFCVASSRREASHAQHRSRISWHGHQTLPSAKCVWQPHAMHILRTLCDLQAKT